MLNEKEKELDSKELDVTISETEKITENKEIKLNFDDLSLEELVEKQEERRPLLTRKSQSLDSRRVTRPELTRPRTGT